MKSPLGTLLIGALLSVGIIAVLYHLTGSAAPDRSKYEALLNAEDGDLEGNDESNENLTALIKNAKKNVGTVNEIMGVEEDEYEEVSQEALSNSLEESNYKEVFEKVEEKQQVAESLIE